MNRRILVEMATNEESEIFAQEPVASVPLPVTVFSVLMRMQWPPSR